jgi:hypothetical protein
MTRTNQTLLLCLSFISILALACTLSSSAPPTLVPRSTLSAGSPGPTLAFDPVVTQGSVPESAPVPTPQIDVEMYNLLREVESDRLMMHISNLQGFHTRHVNSSQTDPTRGVGAAANYLLDQLFQIQAESPSDFYVFPQGHEFTAYFNGVQSVQRNIVGVLGGTEQGAGTIVVGAHYDSRTNDLNDSTSLAPGADDNGSGVAAVLELARILSRHPQRTTVVFVLFAAEEVNRQGSIAFVREYIVANNVDVVAMLNLDTIGSNNSSDGTINDDTIRLFSDEDNTNRSASRHLARTIEFISANHDYGLTHDIQVVPSQDRDGRYGDHFSFADEDYPAIRFIEAVEDTPFREGRDLIEYVEPDYLAQSTRTVLSVIVGLSGGLRPPRQLQMREAGTDDQSNTLYTLVWETVPGAVGYVVALRSRNSLIYNQQFTVTSNESGAWHRFGDYEAVAISAIDGRGLVGPVSQEYIIDF